MNNLENIIKATSNIRLLYVEDNEQARIPTLALLSEFFKTITVAVDGEDGLKQFDKNVIDLVITDINMPKMNGLDMIESIREQSRDTPVLLLSAYSEIEYFKKSIELGVDGYLFKPVDMNQFLELISKVVETIEIKKQLADNMHFLTQYEEATNETVIVSKTDLTGHISYVNRLFCEVSQYTQEELIGQNQNIIRHPDNPASQYENLWDTIQNKKQIWKGIIRNRAKNGSSFYVDAVIKPILDINGNVLEYIGMRHDITEVMSPKKQLLDYIETAKKPFISRIQIESFDNLQNYYGYEFATTLDNNLQEILKLNKPKEFDSFFTLDNGGYIFGVDLKESSEERCLELIKVLQEFQSYISSIKIEIGNISYDISVLLAISYDNSVYENVRYGIAQLIKQKENFLVTNELANSIHTSAQKNLKILQKVKVAIDKSKIVSYFQPIVNSDGTVAKYESLVRLIEEDGTVMSPYLFLDVAKQAKYYTQITSIVLRNSFAVLKEIESEVTINLSAIDIEQKNVRDEIYELLEKCGKSSKRVTFELLEDEEIKDFEVIRTFIQRVKSFGVKIAIDDFGSGYSNYERLLDFEPDIIKIDGSLVKNIETSEFSVSVVTSVIFFAKDQGMKVVAEYVENEAIFKILVDLGVDYFQGYYFGTPKPIGENHGK